MPFVILARHGRTAANASGVLAGRSPGVSLDDTGRAQAHAAAARLAGVDLVQVISSPMQRCLETAEALRNPENPAVVIDDGLNECDYGDWSGQHLKELAATDLWKVVQRQPSAARFPRGESMAEMSARAVSAVRRHDARASESHGPQAAWLAVSHGDIIKAILADAMGLHLDQFQRLVIHPASLSVIEYQPSATFVHTVNSTSGEIGSLLPKPAAEGATPDADAAVGGGAGPSS